MTAPRTDWWDADNRLANCPGEVTAIFLDGPAAGWRVITCRGDHPPLTVEYRGVTYERVDEAVKLSYREAK